MINDISVLVSKPNLQVNIDVHFPESLLELDKNIKKKLPGTMRRIAMEGKSFWKSEAGRKLKSSRRLYQDAIDFQVVDETSFYLSLEGFLAYSVDYGNKSFDMKPGLLKNAKVSKLGGRYRVIPLNVNRYINMQKPTVFRTVSDRSASTSWIHPGWKGMRISEAVVEELDKKIIPKHMHKLLGDV